MANLIETALRKTVTQGVLKLADFNRRRMPELASPNPFLTGLNAPMDQELTLTELAVTAFKDQMQVAGEGPYLFPSEANPLGHQVTFKTAWAATLRRATVPYFRIYDLRSTYATRLSAGGVADEWVTQLLRQGDAKVFKKYSQMKLQMKREALQKMNRKANEDGPGFDTVRPN